jgi:hypothetical protein
MTTSITIYLNFLSIINSWQAPDLVPHLRVKRLRTRIEALFDSFSAVIIGNVRQMLPPEFILQQLSA